MNKAQAAAAAKEQRAAQYALVTKLEKLGHKHGAVKPLNQPLEQHHERHQI